MSASTGNRNEQVDAHIARGDELRKQGQHAQAIEAYLSAATAEHPAASLCLKLARAYEKLQQPDRVARWALAALDADASFLTWQSASQIAGKVAAEHWPRKLRKARVAVLGSYTTTQFIPLLRVALMKVGIEAELYESHFGQYQQEILDPSSGLYAFAPDLVIFATHEGELRLPAFSRSPQADIDAELARWTGLWSTLQSRCSARIVQHNFVVSDELPMGHLSTRQAGARSTMVQHLNLLLGNKAGNAVAIVDCDRLAASFGKRRWLDARYWHLSKQAVALDALPLLARHTAAVINAELGLSKKCLVLDLDNTLWGGVIGEDGLAGIKLGGGAAGEAFVAFQEFILRLKDKGIILAVSSKNNDADAREPFVKHPEMRIKLDDIAVFNANWSTKPENIRQIAKLLNIGIDALVFVDDNPVERQALREFIPEVDVITLPTDPSGYVSALADYLLFETSSFTEEDAQRAAQYRARAQIAELESSATSLDDFYRSLKMQAIVQPFNDLTVPRVVQLIGKSNQFNLTTYRHNAQQIQQFRSDPNVVHLTLSLRDRFADHGLVSVVIARKVNHIMDIDTWLMSCRVIGRTVEAELLKHIYQHAQAMGCTLIRGTYIPSAKNAMVKEVYAKYGFELVKDDNGTTTWHYDINAKGPLTNEFIENVSTLETANDAA